MRLIWIFLLLAAAVLIPFAIWGEDFEALFSEESAAVWLRDLGSWGWLAGIGLMVSDIVLPVPGTAVISALGYVYGWLAGGLAGAAGSTLSGLLAYGLCRRLGHRAAVFIAGEHDLEMGERIFRGPAGGWLVALSRWLPVMPEVVSCLAGLSKMPFGRFLVALICGSTPLGFAFAAIGSAGQGRPGLAVALSALVPALLWFAIKPVLDRHSAATGPGRSGDPTRSD